MNNGNNGPPLDLRPLAPPGASWALNPVSPYSEIWANVVKPFTWAIFLLLAAVFLIPFLFAFGVEEGVRTELLDWAKTILAPIVGFASATVGYYYGTRQGTETGAHQKEEGEND